MNSLLFFLALCLSLTLALLGYVPMHLMSFIGNPALPTPQWIHGSSATPMRRAVTTKRTWTYLTGAARTVTGYAARTIQLAVPKVRSSSSRSVTLTVGFKCVDDYKKGGPSCVNGTIPTTITETDAAT